MKSNVIGVIAGVAVGALLGVLFAPDKGSKTRKKIKRKTIEAKENAKQEFDNMLNTVSKKFSSAQETGEKLAQEGKQLVKKVKAAI